MATSSYSPMQKTLHWLTFLLIIGLYGLALAEDLFERGDPGRAMVWWLHISFGLMLAVMVAARLGLRLTRGAPDLPASMAGHERALAHLTHIGLYGLMIALPLLGIVLTWLRGDTLTFFGLFTIPAPFAPDRALGRTVKEIHELAANLILALAALHTAAALWHHHVRRDDVLKRMMPGSRAEVVEG
ncbi:cytochrome b [Azospirillum griseum]|uniref:Cytochrome b n=1 Tax=Azospirillum griseum TaxID=2496639 RepID=A0A431VFA3_9PROT|nr:cytochrome b [Azospirillum griseum]RTR18138.1 cytochrome b [Azospirillum griseum]